MCLDFFQQNFENNRLKQKITVITGAGFFAFDLNQNNTLKFKRILTLIRVGGYHDYITVAIDE